MFISGCMRSMSATVAAQSGAWPLIAQALGSWVRMPLKTWMFVRVFPCCAVLCRKRPCDGIIAPAKCLSRLSNLVRVRRST